MNINNELQNIPKIPLEQIYDENIEDKNAGERVTSVIWNEVIQTLRTHINQLIPYLRDVTKWEGIWDIEKSYYAGSIVFYDHDVYVAKQFVDVKNIIDISNSEYWEKIAIQGVGIADITFNKDYTLTITLTDGTSYNTTSVRGETGAAANISNVTASVDANVGTPEVNVTLSGPDTERVIDLAFKNIKGNQGDSGVYVGSDPIPESTVVQVNPNGSDYLDIVDRNYVDEQDVTLQEHIDLKADKTYVDTALEKKADKTYVDTELEKKADTSYVNDNFANTLKGNASGSVISVDDVSPIQHNVKCKAESKNLIKLPYYDVSKTQNGITYSIGRDSSLTCSGFANGYSAFNFASKEPLGTMKNKKITLSGLLEGNNILLQIALYGDEGYIQAFNIFEVGASVTIDLSQYPQTTKYYLQVKPNQQEGQETNAKIKPQIEIGSVATPYTPYVDVSNTNLNVCGKNLFSGEEYTDYPTNLNNTFVNFRENIPIYELPKKFTFSSNLYCGDYSDTNVRVSLFDKNNEQLKIIKGNSASNTNHLSSVTINLNDYPTAQYVQFRVRLKDGGSTKDTMLYDANLDDSYEPYKNGGTFTPTADGTVNGIKSIAPNMTILSDTDGVNIEAEYNRDINKAFEKLTNTIISLGGNV